MSLTRVDWAWRLNEHSRIPKERRGGRQAAFEARSLSVVLQVALHELAVAFEVQQAVAAVVERNHGLLAPLLRLEREIDRAANRVARLRGGDQPFGLREDLARLERAELVHRARLDQPGV